MRKIKECEVHIEDRHLGTLLELSDRTVFVYSASFLDHGFDLGSLEMPRRPGSMTFNDPAFHRLPPIFADSLPDSFGQAVMRQWFDKQYGRSYIITPIDRLCNVGETGLGALCYRPGEKFPKEVQRDLNLRAMDKLARSTEPLPENPFLEKMRRVVRTVGGAYPKILAVRSGSDWRILRGRSPIAIQLAENDHQTEFEPRDQNATFQQSRRCRICLQ